MIASSIARAYYREPAELDTETRHPNAWGEQYLGDYHHCDDCGCVGTAYDPEFDLHLCPHCHEDRACNTIDTSPTLPECGSASTPTSAQLAAK